MTLWPSEIYVYCAILLLTVCSVITRAGFMLFGDYVPLSDNVRRALRYAPAAALTAIVVPDLLPWKAGLGPVFDYKLVAGVLAVLVFLRTRSRCWSSSSACWSFGGCAGWRAESSEAEFVRLVAYCPSGGRFCLIGATRRAGFPVAPGIRRPALRVRRAGCAKIRVIHSNPGLVLPS